MVDKIDKSLAGRINQYVEYRRNSGHRKASFDDELENRYLQEPIFNSGIKPAVTRRMGAYGGRSAQGAGQMSGGPQQLRHITTVQARRLATYAPAIQEASRRFQVPVELICAVILQESGGNAQAVSHCGARGLMQLMPGTAKRMGVANSFNPVENVMGGTKYLRNLLDRFDGNISLALAGYNSGEGNVAKYGNRIPPFRETQAYVPSVLKYASTLWTIIQRPTRRIETQQQQQSPTVYHHTIFNTSRKV